MGKSCIANFQLLIGYFIAFFKKIQFIPKLVKKSTTHLLTLRQTLPRNRRMEIDQIIKAILRKQPFVSLRGIGSFYYEYLSAYQDSETHRFEPPSWQIAFDSRRDFDDNAIEQFLINEKGVERERAEIIVAESLEQIKETLKTGTPVHFDGLGALIQLPEQEIEFIPEKRQLTACDAFGLGAIALPERRKREVRVEKKEKRKKKGRQLQVAFLVGLLVSASFFLFDPLHLFFRKTDGQNETNDKIANQSVIAATADSVEILEDNLPITDSSLLQSTALHYSESNPRENVGFYIIAGSFSSKENAAQLSKELNARGYSSQILLNNELYRVYIGFYTNKALAQRKLKELREELGESTFWLLRVDS